MTRNHEDVTPDVIALVVGVGLAVALCVEDERGEDICDRCGAPPRDCVCSRGGD